MMKSACAAAILALAATVASAHHEESGFGQPAQLMNSLPGESWTVASWYKRTVYDPQQEIVGQVTDVLIDHDGKVSGVILDVGGFAGIPWKHVAVPINALLFKKMSGAPEWRLFMNTTKAAVAAAPAYHFDSVKDTWAVDTSAAATVGGEAR